MFRNCGLEGATAVVLFAASPVLLFSFGAPAMAQPRPVGDTAVSEEEAEEKDSRRRSWLDRLQVHGALSQAYAESRFLDGGPVGAERILGISEEGTTDYRTMALQFRYELSKKDEFILQLSHRRLGTSPINEIESDVELDWAFYEHQFDEASYLRVGRIQIPIGIFNQVRDIGTVLPFYRPAYMFYREGSFSSETVDGLLLGHTFDLPGEWSLLTDAFYGGWDLVEFAPGGTGGFYDPATLARAEDAIGGHLWLDTPIMGVRFGAGAQQYLVTKGFLRHEDETTRWSDWHLSFDADFDRFVVRSEFRHFNFFATTLAPKPINVDLESYYVQVGFRATEHWAFFLQSERTNANRESESFTAPSRYRFWQDDAVSINYRYGNMVFKVEGHFLELDVTEVVSVTPTPEGPLLTWGNHRAKGGRQFIASLSVSF